MWEYKILMRFRVIHNIMKEVSGLEVSIANPLDDEHELIAVGLDLMDKYGWMNSNNVTPSGHLAYFLAKEFKNLYDYYHGWRHNTIGLNLALSLTECLRCIEEQKKYGLPREDADVYVSTLNKLRRDYLQNKVLGKDTGEAVCNANSVFKDLRKRVLALFEANYPNSVKGLKL